MLEQEIKHSTVVYQPEKIWLCVDSEVAIA
jgi:hypothetical protein